MAQYEIISQDGEYYSVKVTFSDQEFVQPLISAKKGVALEKQFQEYADDYETAWMATRPPQETEPGQEPGEAPQADPGEAPEAQPADL